MKYLIMRKAILLLLLLSSNLAFSSSYEYIGNYSRKLLDTLKWDQIYELNRKKDITYLFGNINGAAVQALTLEQKNILIQTMQDAALKQLMADKDYFKNYLLEQYNQFFTLDELKKLTAYYNTSVMQMVINAQLTKKPFTVEQIEDKLLSANNDDEAAIKQMRNSYLKARFTRFKEKMDPQINEMIYNRTKEVIDAVIKKIPDFVKEIKS